MKKFIPIILLGFIFPACKTNYVHISVMDPAPVTVPNTIRKAGVLNRSIPSDDAKTLNTIHQVLSGETAAMVKEGSAESIRGLKDALMENNRFELVKQLDSTVLKGPGFGIFAAPLSWEQVESICRANNIDALFALEMFDTELKINPIVIPPKTTNPLDVIASVQQQVNMETTVKTGWRIYDPGNRLIVDEYTIFQNMTFTARGVTVVAATGALISRKEAVKQTANKVGHMYADRILPYWTKVTRDYYVKANSNFKIAKRKARTGNWNGAAEIWEKETTNSSRKVAGRACYNMAIINEINGNLDKAIEWAQKSYENYNIRLARNYVNMLRNRKYQSDRLKSQEIK